MPAISVADEIQELRLLSRTVGLNDQQTNRFRALMEPAVNDVDRKLEAIKACLSQPGKTPAALLAFTIDSVTLDVCVMCGDEIKRVEACIVTDSAGRNARFFGPAKLGDSSTGLPGHIFKSAVGGTRS
jgi:hypothetical protein